MCYSALVKQNLKELSLQFRARIDNAAFEDLFRRRLDGEDLKIPKALEYNFRHNPKTAEDKRIAKLIEQWIEKENAKDQAKIEAQKERLKGALEKLKVKPTKKAEDDKRIAGNWIEKLNGWIERRSRIDYAEGDARIFPQWYFPMIHFDGKENVIAPFRYHMRPEGKPESFDEKFDGTYNARRNRLHTPIAGEGKSLQPDERPVPWWEATYGKKHGLMVIWRFYENVLEHRYHGKLHPVGGREKSVVVSFDPGKGREMLVPMLYANWRAKGKPPVDGAAAITFDPAPEVAAAGHDRTVGRLKSENVEGYLRPEGKSVTELDEIIDDHQAYHFTAALEAA
jgi:hypothetical protein